MRTARSLRLRLILAALAWVVAGMVASYFLLSSIFRHHATVQFYHELDVHVEELQRLTRWRDDAARLASPFSDPRYEVPRSGYYWEVRRGDDTVLSSPSLGDYTLTMPVDQLKVGISPHRHMIDGPTGRLFVAERLERASGGRIVRFIVGTDKRELDEMVAGFNRILMLALAGLGGLLVLSAAGLLSLGLAPFNRLARQLRRLRQGETDTIEGAYPQEVKPLVDELNALLETGRENLTQARIQAGNLAHGLRGSLSIIADEAGILSEQASCAPASAAILAETRRMQRHIDHHIARARAAAVARMPGVRTKVGEAVEALARAMRRINSASGVALELDLEDGLWVNVDPQDFNEILGNLVENAYRYARRAIRITARRAAPGIALIQVEDDGPGLPVEAYEVVLQPGTRWDEARSGSGLGLAIVKETVSLYEGQLDLSQSSLGGLQVSIRLPASRKPAG